VIEKTWNDVVNDTANVWQSIFYRALGPQKSLELYGIPLPKGEKEKGWLGYLRIIRALRPRCLFITPKAAGHSPEKLAVFLLPAREDP
jgi:hypothetical protein